MIGKLRRKCSFSLWPVGAHSVDCFANYYNYTLYLVSKVFFKSMKITPLRRSLSILTHQLSFVSNKTVKALCSEQKPDWPLCICFVLVFPGNLVKLVLGSKPITTVIIRSILDTHNEKDANLKNLCIAALCSSAFAGFFSLWRRIMHYCS